MMLIKEKIEKGAGALKEKLGVKNNMALPRLSKVVVSTGTGKIQDKQKKELIPDRLAKITGQKPAHRQAKQSVAGFKLRQGDVIGEQVTLRGQRMYDFLDRLINVSIPRQRDFRGVDPKSVDKMGNLTIGIKESTIFPETADEELKNVFGMSITIVTTTTDAKKSMELFKVIGIPFKK